MQRDNTVFLRPSSLFQLTCHQQQMILGILLLPDPDPTATTRTKIPVCSMQIVQENESKLIESIDESKWGKPSTCRPTGRLE